MLAAVGAPSADNGQQHQLPKAKRARIDFDDSGQQHQLPKAKRARTDFDEPSCEDDASGAHAAVSYYPMKKKPHGYALIINNKNFDGKPKWTRHGTDADRENLDSVLTQLGYKVVLRKNLSRAEIEELFNEYGDTHDHKDYDSFVCCILSHGAEGQVYGSDTQLIKIRDLSRKLADCESLRGKPKIFFIQACQGHEKPEQVPQPDHVQEEDSDPDKDVAFLPRDSDLFIGYATTPETVALRHPKVGSWYIQELCEVLRNNMLGENKLDLVTMVTKVHHAVAAKREYCYKWTEGGKTHEYRQQPQMISTLRHQVKF